MGRKTKGTTEAAAEPKRTAREKFALREVHRSDLKNAPYNPRVINDRARKAIRENIERVGLVQPVVWNERTGNLVGGHQRMAALDSLEGTKDYRLTVAVVSLDEKTEKEQNVFLNNDAAMGDFDLEKLNGLLGEVDALNTGFNMAEIYQMFGDQPAANMAEGLVDLSEQVERQRETYKKLLNRTNGENDVDFYFVVVFANNAEREAVAKLCGLADNKYFDGRQMAQIVKEWGEFKRLKELEAGHE